jgi:hypothetical protein
MRNGLSAQKHPSGKREGKERVKIQENTWCLNIDVFLNKPFLRNKMQNEFFPLFDLAHQVGCILETKPCFPGNHGELIRFSDKLSASSKVWIWSKWQY